MRFCHFPLLFLKLIWFSYLVNLVFQTLVFCPKSVEFTDLFGVIGQQPTLCDLWNNRGGANLSGIKNLRIVVIPHRYLEVVDESTVVAEES